MPVKSRDIHARSLGTSSFLSELYVARHIAPRDVIQVLNAVRVKYMLVGVHGLGGWTREPRATQDVDVLVATRGHRKAVQALLAAFPDLRAEDHEMVTRLRDLETEIVVIDVLKPNQPLYRDALKHTHPVESDGQQYLVPSLEMALAMKFSAMISLTRSDDKKHYDAGDFIRIVKANPGIDLGKLHALGQLVYNGGGDEVVEKVRQVRAGEKLIL